MSRTKCRKVCEVSPPELVLDEEVIEDVEDRNIIVAYVKHGENSSEFTPIGKILVEYLIREKLNPRAHVIYLNKCMEYKSLYNFDLMQPIRDMHLDVEIILNKTTFLTDEEAHSSLERLLGFLTSDSNMDYEREKLAEDTRTELRKIARKIAAIEELAYESVTRSTDLRFYSNPPVSVTPKSSRIVSRTVKRSKVPTFTPTTVIKTRKVSPTPTVNIYEEESED